MPGLCMSETIACASNANSAPCTSRQRATSRTEAHHLGSALEPLPDWSKDRTFSISRNGPMARHFEGDRVGNNALTSLITHFQTVDRNMRDLRKNSDYGKSFTDDLCNREHSVNLVAVRVKTRTLGFGPFLSSCITELKSDNSRQLWDTIMTFQKSVKVAGTKALKASIAKWKDAYVHSHFTYHGTIQRCELAHVVGYRVRGIWSILGSVTQHPVIIRKEDWKRQYIEELLQPRASPSSGIGNQRMKLRMYQNNLTWVNDTTTSLSIWGGIPASSIFSETALLDENPGISAALVRGKQWTQQAEDSTTISNISIMVLSLSLALVPIALFADVRKLVAFAYALITDVVSCMPLFIKGIELIRLSRISVRATRTWVYGMETDTDVAIAETWTARCQSHNSLFIIGATFISVAVFAMATGLTLEVVTRRKLKRNKQSIMLNRLEAENDALKHMWAQEAPCDNCSCYATLVERLHSAQVVRPLGSTGILSSQRHEITPRSRAH